MFVNRRTRWEPLAHNGAAERSRLGSGRDWGPVSTSPEKGEDVSDLSPPPSQPAADVEDLRAEVAEWRRRAEVAEAINIERDRIIERQDKTIRELMAGLAPVAAGPAPVPKEPVEEVNPMVPGSPASLPDPPKPATGSTPGIASPRRWWQPKA